MQSSFLILSLALGLPGAPACKSQQQELPRVGQNPSCCQQTPAATAHAESDDSDADDGADADDDADEMDGDEMEMEVADADDCASAEEPKDCCAKVQGHLTLDGLGGQVHTLTIQPGSAVIVETKDGKHVKLRTQTPSPLAAMVLDESTQPMLLGALAQAAPQSQDARVRELEQRVRELEAQLRERDGQPSRNAPRTFARMAPQMRSESQALREQSEAQRAEAQELRARVSAQARDYAQQARRQAQEMRRQAEVMREQALEQAKRWHVQSRDAGTQELFRWKAEVAPEGGAATAPAPDLFVELPRFAVDAPAPEVPEVLDLPGAPECAPAPQAEAVPVPPATSWSSSTPAPRAKSSKGQKSPKSVQLPKIAEPGHMQDMKAMMDQMRAQMEEMREQMRALREELQNAPQRELR
jgi:hypothetical protein